MPTWIVKTLVGAAISLAVKESVNLIKDKRQKANQPSNIYQQYITISKPVSTSSSLVRKDQLTTSMSFFEEGIQMLQLSLEKLADAENNGDKKEGNEQPHRSTAAQTDPFVVLFGCDVQEIAKGIRKLKTVSGESFEWAKSSFKAAREEATKTFNNTSLTTKDRIQAAKLRILSAILGCLEEPVTATVACKIYLKELHAMSDVCMQFRDHFKVRNNTEKQFNKRQKRTNDERLEISTSVALINYIVFHFTETLAENTGLLNVKNWPTIQVFDNHFLHPVRNLEINQVIRKNEEHINQEPQSLSFDELIDPTDMAVNSKGDFIIANLDSSDGNGVKVFNSSCKFQFAFFPTKQEEIGLVFEPQAVSTDEDDNIYLYTKAKGLEYISTGFLFTFDKDGQMKRKILTECGRFMALDKSTNRIFLSGNNGIYVYDNSGEYLCSVDVAGLLGSMDPFALCDN